MASIVAQTHPLPVTAISLLFATGLMAVAGAAHAQSGDSPEPAGEPTPNDALSWGGEAPAEQAAGPSDGSAETSGPSPQDLRAAAEAYDRGTAAYVAHRYDSAARWFETAHRMVPSASALLQAVQAHQLAGDRIRGANLAIRLAGLYPDDQEAVALSETVLADAQTRFVRLSVRCVDCQVSVDGRLLEHFEAFVEPAAEHLVEGTFETGEVEERFSADVGELVEMELVAPVSAAPGEGSDGGDGVRGPGTERPAIVGPPDDDDGLPPWVSIAGVAATAVALGITIWSGVDTLVAANEFNDDPTRDRYDDGLSRARRTHWGIGITAALGVATLGVAAFGTDWAGDEEPPGAGGRGVDLTGTFGISPDGGTLGVHGRF